MGAKDKDTKKQPSQPAPQAIPFPTSFGDQRTQIEQGIIGNVAAEQQALSNTPAIQQARAAEAQRQQQLKQYQQAFNSQVAAAAKPATEFAAGISDADRKAYQNTLAATARYGQQKAQQKAAKALPDYDDDRFRSIVGDPSDAALRGIQSNATRFTDLKTPVSKDLVYTNQETKQFNPTFKREVIELAGGDEKKFKQAADAIVQGKKNEFQQANNYNQDITDFLHDGAGGVLKPVGYIWGAAKEGLRASSNFGAFLGRGLLEPLYDATGNESAARNVANTHAQWLAGSEQYLGGNRPTNEADLTTATLTNNPFAYLDTILGTATRTGGEFLGPSVGLGALSKGASIGNWAPAANAAQRGATSAALRGALANEGTLSQKAFDGLAATLQSMPARVATRYIDNVINTTAYAYPTIYASYFKQALDSGYTPQQASAKAAQRASVNILIEGLANPLARRGAGSNLSNRIVNSADEVIATGRVQKLGQFIKQNVSPRLGQSLGEGVEEVFGSGADSYQDWNDAGRTEPFDWKGAVEQAAHEGLVGTVAGGMMSSIGQHGTQAPTSQAAAIYQAMASPENFRQSITEQLQSGRMTPEQASQIQNFIGRVEPFVARAIQPKDKGGQALVGPKAVQYGIEQARLQETAAALAAIAPEIRYEEITDVNTGQKTQVLMARDANGIFTREAGQAVEAQVQDLQAKAAASTLAIKQIEEGTDLRGRTVSGVEMAAISQRYTPAASLRGAQTSAILNNGPYTTESIDITPYANDPEVRGYIQASSTPASQSITANTNPVVIGKDGQIIDGKKRIAAALATGQTTMDIARPLTAPELSVAVQEEHDATIDAAEPNLLGTTSDFAIDIITARDIYDAEVENDRPVSEAEMDAGITTSAMRAMVAATRSLVDEGRSKEEVMDALQRMRGENVPSTLAEGAYNIVVPPVAQEVIADPVTTGETVTVLEPTVAETPDTEGEFQPIVVTEEQLNAAPSESTPEPVVAEEAEPNFEITPEFGDLLGQLEAQTIEQAEEPVAPPIQPFVDAIVGNSIVMNTPAGLTVRNVDTGNERPANKQEREGAAAKYNFLQGALAPQPDAGVNRQEYEASIIENSTNPVEIATIWRNMPQEPAMLDTIEQAIVDQGGFTTTQDSFNQFGDRNNMNRGIAANYIGKKGQKAASLDQIAIDLNGADMDGNNGLNITPQDLVDFMYRFPGGVDQAVRSRPSSNQRLAEDKFEQLTGFPLNDGIADIVMAQEEAQLQAKEKELLNQEYGNQQDLENAYYEAVRRGEIDLSGEVREAISREVQNTPQTNSPAETAVPVEEAAPEIDLFEVRPGTQNIFTDNATMNRAGWTRQGVMALHERIKNKFKGEPTLVVVDNESARQFLPETFAEETAPKGWYDAGSNTMFINVEEASPSTPIHELGHVWAAWARVNAPDIYARGEALAKETDAYQYASALLDGQQPAAPAGMSASDVAMWQRYAIEYGQAEDKSEARAAIAEEILAQTIEQEAQNIPQKNRKGFSAWLKSLWDTLKKSAGFNQVTAQQFANISLQSYSRAVLAELSSANSLTRRIKEIIDAPNTLTRAARAERSQNRSADAIDESIAIAAETAGQRGRGSSDEDSGELTGVYSSVNSSDFASRITNSVGGSQMVELVAAKAPDVYQNMLDLVEQTQAFQNASEPFAEGIMIDMLENPAGISAADKAIVGGLVHKGRGTYELTGAVAEMYGVLNDYISQVYPDEVFSPLRFAESMSARSKKNGLTMYSLAPQIDPELVKMAEKKLARGTSETAILRGLAATVGPEVAQQILDKAKPNVEFTRRQEALDRIGLTPAAIAEGFRAVIEAQTAGKTQRAAINDAVRAIKANHDASIFNQAAFEELVNEYVKPRAKTSIGTTINNATRTDTTGMADLKNQIRMEARAALEGFRAGRTQGQQEGEVTGERRGRKEGISQGKAIAQAPFETAIDRIKEHLATAQAAGTVTPKQVAAIIKRGLAVGENAAKLDAFITYTDKILADAEYDAKLKDAQSVAKKIRAAVRSKAVQKAANNVDAVKAFLRIKPDVLANLDEYLAMADRVLSTISNAKANAKNGTVANADYQATITDIEAYVQSAAAEMEVAKKEQEQRRRDRVFADLVAAGTIDPATASPADIQAAIDDQLAQIADDRAAAAVTNAEERLRLMKAYVDDQLIDLDNYDISNLSAEETEVLDNIRQIDTTDLEMPALVKLNDVINNITYNDSFTDAGDMSALSIVQRNMDHLIQLMKDSGVNPAELKSGIAKAVAGEIASINLLNEFITKNTRVAAELQRLSGQSELFNGHARAQKTQSNAIKAYEELVKNMPDAVMDAENKVMRGVYALSQMNFNEGAEKDAAEFERIKGLVAQTADRLNNSGDKNDNQKGKYVSDAYNALLEGSNSPAEVEAKLIAMENGADNQKIVEFWQQQFADRRETVAENSEIYSNIPFEEVNNYTPITYSKLRGVKDQAAASTMFDQTFSRRKIDETPAGTKNRRRRYFVLPGQNAVLDLDFDSAAADRFYETNYDVETNKAKAQIRMFLDNKNAETVFGTPQNKELVQTALTSAADAQRGKTPQVSQVERMVEKGANIAAAKAARIALGSFSQLAKQYVSVAGNTMANLGSDFSLFPKAWQIGTNLPLFDQFNIGQRGSTKAGYNRDTDFSRVDRTEFGNSFQRTLGQVDKIGQRVADATMAALVYSDVKVARTSWLAFYMQSLKEQGVDIDSINWAEEHNSPNAEAAAYAEQMTSRSQNANDASSMGQMYRKGGWGRTMLRIFLPYSGFATNQRVRMTNDAQKLLFGNKNVKAEAARSLAATMAEAAIFNAVKIFVIGIATTAAARGLASMLGMWDDDDDKFAEETDTAKNLQKFAANSISDYFFAGMGGFTQTKLNELSNYLIKGMNGASEKEPGFFSVYDPAKYGEYDYGQWGMFGGPLQTAANAGSEARMAITGQTDRYKGNMFNQKVTRVDIAPNERQAATIGALVDGMALLGVSEADVSAINRKLQQIRKKKMQVKYGGSKFQVTTSGKGRYRK